MISEFEQFGKITTESELKNELKKINEDDIKIFINDRFGQSMTIKFNSQLIDE